MGSKSDVIKSFMDAAWSNPPSSVIEANKKYLADNFQSYDSDSKPLMDKQGYIGFAQMFLNAFPDVMWVRSGLREVGDSVIMRGHFEGTHMGEVDLSAMGMGVIPASGKKIVWPEDSVEYKVEGEQVLSEKATSGLKEMLAPLGLKMP